MRGLLLALLTFGSTPWMLRMPFVGLLFWLWFGLMNPHRLTFGWTYSFAWVQLVGGATMLGWLLSREPRRIPMNGTTILWLLFTLWCTFTTLFALNPQYAWLEWERFVKVQVMILFMLLMLVNRERIELAVLVIAVSIGFYGVKGGIFTILGGGQYMVWGPAKSFIAGNTEIGFAMVVTAPLIWYLRSITTHRWLRFGATAAFSLCLISILGSYSRGAFLALGAMLFFLWLRSRGKVVTALAAIVAIGVGLSLMPEKWFERMGTIQTYQQDRSAMGRLNAWSFAINLANDRPIAGGGFRTFTPELFLRYAPEPEQFHDAHSIVFEVLGEQGYVGLILFLGLGLATFMRAFVLERRCKGHEDLGWAAQLSRMCQVSLVGYLVGGAFLGLAYFDLPYTIMAIVVATAAVVQRRIREGVPASVGSWRPAIKPPGPPPPTPLRQPVVGRN